MSIRAVQAVIDRSKAKGTELLVLILIANRSLDDGSLTWIAQKTLCKESKFTDRGLRKILRRLQADDEIDIIANTDKTVPNYAKFAPRQFYRIRCLANGQGGESHRNNVPELCSGEEKATEQRSGRDRNNVPVGTGTLFRSDLKEGSVQGSVQGTIRPRGDLEYLNKAAPAKAKGAPSTKAFDTKPDDDEKPDDDAVRVRMAAELSRQRVAQKRFH